VTGCEAFNLEHCKWEQFPPNINQCRQLPLAIRVAWELEEKTLVRRGLEQVGFALGQGEIGPYFESILTVKTQVLGVFYVKNFDATFGFKSIKIIKLSPTSNQHGQKNLG
jgi:hypothetical protein